MQLLSFANDATTIAPLVKDLFPARDDGADGTRPADHKSGIPGGEDGAVEAKPAECGAGLGDLDAVRASACAVCPER